MALKPKAPGTIQKHFAERQPYLALQSLLHRAEEEAEQPSSLIWKDWGEEGNIHLDSSLPAAEAKEGETNPQPSEQEGELTLKYVIDAFQTCQSPLSTGIVGLPILKHDMQEILGRLTNAEQRISGVNTCLTLCRVMFVLCNNLPGITPLN